MKSIKLALLAGAALAVTAAGAQADDLDALKAQIEELNTRVAAMEAAPSVPTGYQLLAISKGELQQTPGLAMTERERLAYGDRSTIISVMPTADAPAGATISWSGYARAGLVYSSDDIDLDLKVRSEDDSNWTTVESASRDDEDDFDVFARGQLRVKATTDTAVGEVGVDMRIRGDFDGIESEGNNFYMDVAWGYWAMTPELAFGGGYAGTLGDIAYGFDGACTCHYINTLSMNPGDTSQMRLTYASGPFSMAIAVEDASLADVADEDTVVDLSDTTDDRLGVAGEIAYSGDTISGEISGMWRDIDDEDLGPVASEFIPDSWWQIGAGIGFGLGDVAKLSIAASMGEGPVGVQTDSGFTTEYDFFAWNNSFWAVSAVAAFNLTEEVRAEIGGGYRNRDFDDVDFTGGNFDAASASASADYWVVGGGLYYDPVEQLTIGVEASYSVTDQELEIDADNPNAEDYKLDYTNDEVVVDLVSVWRF